MFKKIFSNITETERNIAIETVIKHATPRRDFFVMLFLASSMAAFGILLNNTIILVGSMLIAPLLYPILSLALGLVASDGGLIGRSFFTLIKSVIYSLVASYIIGALFSSHVPVLLTLPIVDMRLIYFIIYFIVAAIAGFAAAFAVAKPYLNETLPGVAISVSLVPPLAAAGVAMSLFDWSLMFSTLLLFFINVIGIVLSTMLVFSLFNFSSKKTVTNWIVEQEDSDVKKEEKASDKPKEILGFRKL